MGLRLMQSNNLPETKPDYGMSYGQVGGTSKLVAWFNEDNFERLRRARQLAGAKGGHPNQIALAYALRESPQVFALIGPENMEELASVSG
jgi:aryl-alcohol dehydrogenase-like predicted oxidoreductase